MLRSPSDIPEDLEGIGIVLGETGPGQFHLGFLVPTDSGPAHIADLASHHWVRWIPYSPDEDLWWGTMRLPLPRQESLAAYVEEYAHRWNGIIPYGPSYPSRLVFDDLGNVRQPEEGKGLTCATFVMSLVRDRLGIQLVDEATWPVGAEEDRQWLADAVVPLIMSAARRAQISGRPDEAQRIQAHAVAVSKAPDSARYKPVEVCAAAIASQDEMPMHFDICVERGRVLQGIVAPAQQGQQGK